MDLSSLLSNKTQAKYQDREYHQYIQPKIIEEIIGVAIYQHGSRLRRPPLSDPKHAHLPRQTGK